MTFDLRDRDLNYGSALAVAALLLGASLLYLFHGQQSWFPYVLLLTGFPLIVTGMTLFAAYKLAGVWHLHGEPSLKLLSVTAMTSATMMMLAGSQLILRFELPAEVLPFFLSALLSYPACGLILGIWWFTLGRKG